MQQFLIQTQCFNQIFMSLKIILLMITEKNVKNKWKKKKLKMFSISILCYRFVLIPCRRNNKHINANILENRKSRKKKNWECKNKMKKRKKINRLSSVYLTILKIESIFVQCPVSTQLFFLSIKLNSIQICIVMFCKQKKKKNKLNSSNESTTVSQIIRYFENAFLLFFRHFFILSFLSKNESKKKRTIPTHFWDA